MKSRSRTEKKPAKAAGKKRGAAESKRSISKKVKAEQSREPMTEAKSRGKEVKTMAVRRSIRLSKS